MLAELFLSPVRDSVPAQAAIVALLLLILLDWVFGIGHACMKHEFSSQKMREGIAHKCAELGFVAIGVIADALITSGLNLGFDGPILLTVTLYLCIMEIGSLCELLVKINPKLADSPIFRLIASANMHAEKEDDKESEEQR